MYLESRMTLRECRKIAGTKGAAKRENSQELGKLPRGEILAVNKEATIRSFLSLWAATCRRGACHAVPQRSAANQI